MIIAWERYWNVSCETNWDKISTWQIKILKHNEVINKFEEKEREREILGEIATFKVQTKNLEAKLRERKLLESNYVQARQESGF